MFVDENLCVGSNGSVKGEVEDLSFIRIKFLGVEVSVYLFLGWLLVLLVLWVVKLIVSYVLYLKNL